jgi:hypothetical protein
MQTFLPFSNFQTSALSLDNKRLNKQRVESYQILRAITDPDYGWQHHPAVNMWRGYDQALLHYALEMCEQWTARGGKDHKNLEGRLIAEFCTGEEVLYPWWLGDERLHISHRANLYFKDQDYYKQYWIFEEEIPYFWPTTQESEID